MSIRIGRDPAELPVGSPQESDSTDFMYMKLAESDESEVRVVVEGSSDAKYITPETADQTMQFKPPLGSSACCLLI
jgi:hypothetical protein